MKSCDGCIHDLGGGNCAVSLEHECRDGGGFEAYRFPDFVAAAMYAETLGAERYELVADATGGVKVQA